MPSNDSYKDRDDYNCGPPLKTELSLTRAETEVLMEIIKSWPEIKKKIKTEKS